MRHMHERGSPKFESLVMLHLLDRRPSFLCQEMAHEPDQESRPEPVGSTTASWLEVPRVQFSND